jgi:hypothetical protein
MRLVEVGDLVVRDLNAAFVDNNGQIERVLDRLEEISLRSGYPKGCPDDARHQ